MKKEEISIATKQKIIDALKHFMSIKDFTKITVKDILEEANITRPTFYYHFEDIYNAMEWMFNEELLMLLKKSEDCVTWDEGILLVLQYVEENRAVCLCAYNSVGREVLQRMFLNKASTILLKFMDPLLEDIKADPDDVKFIAEFYTMAFVSVLIQWMKQPQGRSPENLLQQIDIAMHGNIERALRRSEAKTHRFR